MRWLVVYIQEAHASDEWPVGDLTSVTTQPKSLSHRRELARTAHEDLLGGSVEVLVDDMDNSFQVITSADRRPHLLLCFLGRRLADVCFRRVAGCDGLLADPNVCARSEQRGVEVQGTA